MSRTERSPGELRAVTIHLGYELAMLQYTASFLAEKEPGTEGYFAHLEAFCTHARNLIHFLYPERTKDDDVLAQDFFENPMVWKKGRGAVPVVLKDARNRVSVEVAHLSYERLARFGEATTWPFQQICRAIEESFGIFRSLLPSSRVHESLVASPPTGPSLAEDALGVIPVTSEEKASELTINSVAGMTSAIHIYTVRAIPGGWSPAD
jgi:hypothetical protein